MEHRTALRTMTTEPQTMQTALAARTVSVTPAVPVTPPVPVTPVTAPGVVSNWKHGLPILQADAVTLRELRASDAQTLFALLTTEEVARFISPPPATVEGFERFIVWAAGERTAGRYLCFAVVPKGCETAVGLFQIRQLDPTFGTAEWGFAIGSGFWGSGLFANSAKLVVEFAFEVIGVHRLEARAAIENGRGNGALRKIGAVQEGILRKSFLRGGKHHDQALWAILHEDWYRSKAVWGAKAN
jgi:RimJ/RimL family protein N-acetyltransferase